MGPLRGLLNPQGGWCLLLPAPSMGAPGTEMLLRVGDTVLAPLPDSLPPPTLLVLPCPGHGQTWMTLPFFPRTSSVSSSMMGASWCSPTRRTIGTR